MNFSIIKGSQISGLSGEIIKIETDVSRGLSSFNIIGLANQTVDESRERVLSSLKNSKLPSPKHQNHRVVVSLLPSDKRKTGSTFDLPIAISYLDAIGEFSTDLSKSLFIGELSLNGEIKPVTGLIPMIIEAKKSGIVNVYIPELNIKQGSIVDGINIFACNSLNQIVNHLKRKVIISPLLVQKTISKNKLNRKLDFFKINGCDFPKRGLEIAVAGGHHISFYGSPGSGKTHLAKTISGLLPQLNKQQNLECEIINSVSDISTNIGEPPFRSPHHSASYSAIVGGGTHSLKPGEITLSHNGILFMDEFPEFNKNIIESLRQPLEDKFISISRLNQKNRFPANFLLVIAMNPCPCGYHKSNRQKCICSVGEIKRYRKKMSGPLIDRVDIWIEMDEINYSSLISDKINIDEKEIFSFLDNIKKVREINKKKYSIDKLNSELDSEDISKILRTQNQSFKIKLDFIAEKLNLSARSYLKIIKISKTIADLDMSNTIKEKHLMEALQYRCKL